ncbi:MAG: hypothetical protein K6T86_10250 [Pirellulales bacterium]|nr:hypothetical protein [Pirellulales bacterium]
MSRRAAARCCPAVAVLLAAACLSLAAPPRTAAAEGDGQRLLFLGPVRPLLVRLHITIHGRALEAVWHEYFDRALRRLDRDGNAQFSGEELRDLARLAAGGRVEADPMLTGELERLAGGSAGSLSRGVALEWLRAVAPPLVVVHTAAPRGTAPALFALLDRDGDGALTAEELGRAVESASRRDFNDNQLLTAAELQAAPPVAGETLLHDPHAEQRVMLLSGPTDSAAGLAVMNRYDRDRDGLLRFAPREQAEVLLSAAQAGLDLNGDGALASDELAHLASLAADLELWIPFGRLTAEDRNRPPPTGEPSWVLRRRSNFNHDLLLDDAQIQIERRNRDPAADDTNDPRVSDFDRDNNGYLSPQEAAVHPLLAASFAAIDANGDGMIYADELNPWFRMQAQAASCRVVLEVRDEGQDLFTLIDEDRDGRLTYRELRSAPGAAAAADKNGDGVLSTLEIPLRVNMLILRGTPTPMQASTPPRPARVRTSRPAAASGPAWFNRMDRNEDGELSPREFLGPAAAFQRLDANGDGLIDAQEAGAGGGVSEIPSQANEREDDDEASNAGPG